MDPGGETGERFHHAVELRPALMGERARVALKRISPYRGAESSWSAGIPGQEQHRQSPCPSVVLRVTVASEFTEATDSQHCQLDKPPAY